MEEIVEAVLDVFAGRQLPKDSELWSVPNVIITPRVAGITSEKWPAVLPATPRADIRKTRRTRSPGPRNN